MCLQWSQGEWGSWAFPHARRFRSSEPLGILGCRSQWRKLMFRMSLEWVLFLSSSLLLLLPMCTPPCALCKSLSELVLLVVCSQVDFPLPLVFIKVFVTKLREHPLQRQLKGETLDAISNPFPARSIMIPDSFNCTWGVLILYKLLQTTQLLCSSAAFYINLRIIDSLPSRIQKLML